MLGTLGTKVAWTSIVSLVRKPGLPGVNSKAWYKRLELTGINGMLGIKWLRLTHVRTGLSAGYGALTAVVLIALLVPLLQLSNSSPRPTAHKRLLTCV